MIVNLDRDYGNAQWERLKDVPRADGRPRLIEEVAPGYAFEEGLRKLRNGTRSINIEDDWNGVDFVEPNGKKISVKFSPTPGHLITSKKYSAADIHVLGKLLPRGRGQVIGWITTKEIDDLLGKGSISFTHGELRIPAEFLTDPKKKVW